MDRQITLTVSDAVYRRAEQVARLSGREITEVLSSTLTESLPPLNLDSDLAALSDDEVLALADSKMDVGQSERMSALHHKQNAGTITDAECIELDVLMKIIRKDSCSKYRVSLKRLSAVCVLTNAHDNQHSSKATCP